MWKRLFPKGLPQAAHTKQVVCHVCRRACITSCNTSHDTACQTVHLLEFSTGWAKKICKRVRSGQASGLLFYKIHFLQVVNYILFFVNHRCSRVVKTAGAVCASSSSSSSERLFSVAALPSTRGGHASVHPLWKHYCSSTMPYKPPLTFVRYMPIMCPFQCFRYNVWCEIVAGLISV